MQCKFSKKISSITKNMIKLTKTQPAYLQIIKCKKYAKIYGKKHLKNPVEDGRI